MHILTKETLAAILPKRFTAVFLDHQDSDSTIPSIFATIYDRINDEEIDFVIYPSGRIHSIHGFKLNPISPILQWEGQIKNLADLQLAIEQIELWQPLDLTTI
jgi:hypothetical protein